VNESANSGATTATPAADPADVWARMVLDEVVAKFNNYTVNVPFNVSYVRAADEHKYTVTARAYDDDEPDFAELFVVPLELPLELEGSGTYRHFFYYTAHNGNFLYTDDVWCCNAKQVIALFL
jgi:hypothetical protein